MTQNNIQILVFLVLIAQLCLLHHVLVHAQPAGHRGGGNAIYYRGQGDIMASIKSSDLFDYVQGYFTSSCQFKADYYEDVQQSLSQHIVAQDESIHILLQALRVWHVEQTLGEIREPLVLSFSGNVNLVTPSF